jgi:hypothetical protein
VFARFEIIPDSDFDSDGLRPLDSWHYRRDQEKIRDSMGEKIKAKVFKVFETQSDDRWRGLFPSAPSQLVAFQYLVPASLSVGLLPAVSFHHMPSRTVLRRRCTILTA